MYLSERSQPSPWSLLHTIAAPAALRLDTTPLPAGLHKDSACLRSHRNMAATTAAYGDKKPSRARRLAAPGAVGNHFERSLATNDTHALRVRRGLHPGALTKITFARPTSPHSGLDVAETASCQELEPRRSAIRAG